MENTKTPDKNRKMNVEHNNGSQKMSKQKSK